MKTKIINNDGDTYYLLNDDLHNDAGPALILNNGTEIYFDRGYRHRVGGPAESWAGGEKRWYQNDELHNEDGPAIVTPYTDKGDCWEAWYLHDNQIVHPETFSSMEEWFEYLNDNESETYQWIHDHNGFISFIDKPSGKQTRVHQMAHLL